MGRWAAPEGRVAARIVAITVAAFLVAVAVGGPYFRSFDEAKYLGIGYSMLNGDGPRTVFGAVFLPHSPLWPIVIAAPDVWFGVDPFAWGQFLNALAGAALLLLVGWIGWQIRPLVGALAVAGYVALPYLADLTRTARLDVPAAALALAYVVVGIAAVRRGSVRRGLVAGAIFAIAFCVKEIVLPLAPVPFLVGIVAGRSIREILRVAAATVLVAAVGTAWWFLLAASYTDRVYRLGVPAPFLPLIYLGVAVFVAIGFLMPRRPATARGLPAVVAWAIAVVWFGLLAAFFDRNSELQGVGLVSLGQLRLYAVTWLGSPVIAAVAVVAAVGVAIAVVDRLRSRRTPNLWLDAILISLVCSAPLVLLVIAVGEPPRNYLAQVGLLALLPAAGWLRVAEAAVARARMAPPDRATLQPLLAGVAVAALIGASGLAAWHAIATRATAADSTRAAAVDAAAAWIEANVPPGARIGFGSFLGYETAVDLAGRYRMVQIHQALAVVDPAAPLGLAAGGDRTIRDWVAMDVSRREREFYVFRGSTFRNAVARERIGWYVYLTGPNTSVPPLLGALTPATGFTEVAKREFRSVTSSGAPTVTAVHVFTVDPAHLDLSAAPFYATPEALDRLVGLLLANRATSPATAAALRARATTWPDPAAGPAILDRLKGLAEE